MSDGKRPRSIARRSSSTVPRAAISRATTSRGASSSVKRLPWSSRSTAPSPRSASERRSDESTSVVGWNCTNSRSASAAPARYAAAIPSPTAPAGLVVRSQSAAAPPVDEKRRARRDHTAVGDDADAALVVAPDGQHPLAFGHGDPRMCEHALGELPRDTVAGGGSSSVDDAAAAVTALEAEAFVELDTELHEVADPCGCLVGQHGDGARPAEPAARSQRVLGMERRVVVLPHRGCDAALGEEARGREQRPLREDEDVALGRRAQCREEPWRRPAADDDERRARESSRLCARGSLMVVFASESITSWLSLAPHLSYPRTLRSPPCSRCATARSPSCSGSGHASPTPVPGRFRVERCPQTRRSNGRSCGTSRRRSTCARSRISSSWGPGAIRHGIPSAGSWRPRTSGSCRSVSTRASRPTRRGIPSTRCPRRRSITVRSSSRDATACEGSSRTRTSASRSRPRPSRSPSSAMSTKPRSATRSRPRTSSACSCGAARSSRSADGALTARRAVDLPSCTASGHGSSR